MDKLSHVLCEIMTSSSDLLGTNNVRRSLTYHVVNPQSTTWSALVPKIMSCYSSQTGMKIVPFSEWLRLLERSIESSTNSEENPAIKLLDFYHHAANLGKELQVLDSTKAEKASKTLKRLGAVNGKWVSRWMQQWGIKSDSPMWLPIQ